MSKKVRIDRDLCTGCALCSDEYPDFFGLGDDGIAFVKPGKEESGGDADVQDAADNCPAAAIVVE